MNFESFVAVFFVFLRRRVDAQRSRHVFILIIITPAVNISTERDESVLTVKGKQHKMSRLINIDLLRRRRLEKTDPAEHRGNQSIDPQIGLLASETMTVESCWCGMDVLTEFQFRSVSA